MNSYLKNELENERKEKKDFLYFLIYLRKWKIRNIFLQKIKNNIIKWITIINYFISKQDDYEKCNKTL